MTSPGLFEVERALPDQYYRDVAARLIGFEARYERLRRDLRLLADPEEIRSWSRKHHKRVLALCDSVADRYPLMIFSGDVGTGKTVTAECACDRLARETKKDAMLFKLSTRVRGSGKVGEMGTLINEAFNVVVQEAGKSRSTYLIIDEADSLAASRETDHSHHEDKVAVNTVIQRVDDLRRLGGRVLAILCTNRPGALDPAVIRRAARNETFARPNDQEREELFRLDCEGLAIDAETLKEVVKLTGPRSGAERPGFTFSDLRSRLLPDALSRAFPERPMTAEDLLDAARSIAPSPSVAVR
jgi:AAA+ superfamily predicted ATPase